MEKWTILNIDVDYSPSDPGCRNWYTDNTKYNKEDIKVGERLPYEDSGRLFGSITVKAVSDEGIVVEYRGTDYTVLSGKTAKLDQGGRDYTNFYLHIYLK